MQIAHTLYRLIVKNLRGYGNSEPETLYREFIQGWGRIYNYKDKITVCLSKKRATGCLMNAQFLDGWMVGNILNGWEKNRSLFGSERYYGNYDCENPC